MSRRGKIITALLLIVATLVIVVTVVIVAAILFLRQSGDTQAIGTATSVGVPTGPATTKSIGREGGSISSADGRISVNVPPNAVLRAINFSVQSITNLANGGVGSAYRLEPNGQQFETPIKVSFKYDSPDFKTYRPETLAVAYQDRAGIWQAFTTADVDQENKTLTISTTHFTDESVFTDQLLPEKATLRVRETLEVQLKCTVARTWTNWLKERFGHQFASRCWTIDETGWSVNAGTITRTGPLSAIYQAPATRPPSNKATIRFVYHYKGSSPTKDVRESEITIVGPGRYKVSGQDGPSKYSGVICDLEKPFSVTVTHPLMTYESNFIPTSATAGTASWTGYFGGGAGSGSGPYTVMDTGEDRCQIVWHVASTARVPYASSSGSGDAHIILTPLAANEHWCSDK